MDRLFFDIETTSADQSTARIVQLAILIVNEDNKVVLNKSKMYNPEIPISQAAEDIHGISDKMVKTCPKFSDDAKKLKKLFEDKILITYNGLHFDIPILMNEFDRAGVEVELSGKFIDIFKIEQKLNPRTLSNVYKSYTGKELKEAHDASADTMASSVILEHQMALLEEEAQRKNVNADIEDVLYELSGTTDMVDYYGKFSRDEEGYLVYKFGKFKDHRLVDEMQYATWMLSQNFPSQVKKLIREEQAKINRITFKKRTEVKKGFYPAVKTKEVESLELNFGNVASENYTTNDDLPF